MMTEMEIRSKLDEVYAQTLDEVSHITKSNEEAKLVMEKLAELARQRTTMARIDLDVQARNEEKLAEQARQRIETARIELDTKTRDEELQLKKDQAKSEKHGQVVSAILGLGGLATSVASLILTHTWMKRGMKFEETGTYTTKTGGWISTHLRLFKQK